jgi:hypothetical protein
MIKKDNKEIKNKLLIKLQIQMIICLKLEKL